MTGRSAMKKTLGLISSGMLLIALLCIGMGQDSDFVLSTQDGLALVLSPEGAVIGLTIDGFELVGRPAPALWIRDLSRANETDWSNLVNNPGFESGLSGWRQLVSNNLTVQVTHAQAHSDNKALEFSSSSDRIGFAAYASDPIPVEPGQRYRVSAWWKSREGYLSTLSGTPPNLCMSLYRESRRVTGLYLQWLNGQAIERSRAGGGSAHER